MHFLDIPSLPPLPPAIGSSMPRLLQLAEGLLEARAVPESDLQNAVVQFVGDAMGNLAQQSRGHAKFYLRSDTDLMTVLGNMPAFHQQRIPKRFIAWREETRALDIRSQSVRNQPACRSAS